MSAMRPQAVTLVGAGLAGSLLALALARRGFAVTVYERRPDPRVGAIDAGRSINLALAERGIRALERCGIMSAVKPLLIAMRGRIVHHPGAQAALLPYGLRHSEVIYSVSRAALNRVLIDAAAQQGAALCFGQTCIGVDTDANTLRLRDNSTLLEYTRPLSPCVATDGAGSVVRGHLAARGLTVVRQERLDHGYKELALPSVADDFALEPEALHIWPRGGFMLIALPNLDKTFTATLFLNTEGATSFAGLSTSAAVNAFVTAQFPDLTPFAPGLVAQFARNPHGSLATIHASSWHDRGTVLLLGDAAHAIVPFHGQGMNAAFEDCAAFDELLECHDDWSTLFAEFERLRRPNAAAIAQMALENYIEMRETVLDPKFRRTKMISLMLEERFPDRFVPRYSMVMFHPEIPYAEALHRGSTQAAILDELDERRDPSGDIDARLAERLVTERLAVISGGTEGQWCFPKNP
jgi:kynurenine 3-monooxygenase